MTTTSICLHYKTIYSYVHTILFLFIKCNNKCLEFFAVFAVLLNYLHLHSHLHYSWVLESIIHFVMEKWKNLIIKCLIVHQWISRLCIYRFMSLGMQLSVFYFVYFLCIFLVWQDNSFLCNLELNLPLQRSIYGSFFCSKNQF